MKVEVLILSLLLPSSIFCQTFTNPIIDGNSADPCVTLVGQYYYLILSTSTEHELTIYKSSELTNFRNSESRVIFTAPEGYQNVWASELHEMPDGNLYIYFAMGRVGDFNRNYVIKADDPKNPMGNWSEPIRLLPHLEQPGVDGTILRHGGKLYYAWSGRDMIEGSLPYDSILLTEMISPTETTNRTAVIRQPLLSWERNVNEGPYFFYRYNMTYLIFSASFTFSEYYCLGLMSIPDDLDPMIPSNWWYGPVDGPVFYKNEEEDVYGPGHACTTTSPDGSETWLVYHASEDRERIERYRLARIEKIEWDDENKLPIFPRPHGYYSPIPVPSGQIDNIRKDTFTNPILSGDSPDPRVLLMNGSYYLSRSSKDSREVYVHKSSTLTNFRNTETAKISWDCFEEIWAPEMALLNGELYMYLSGKSCNDGIHSIHVSKAMNSNDPFGSWSALTPLLPGVTAMSADGTVVIINNRMYLVYESREEPYGLWIAEMENPMKVKLNTRKYLKTPTQEWEAGVVNGPASLRHGNRTFVSYSAGNPNGEDYCTGLMWIDDGSDPMILTSWVWKSDGSVFSKTEGVYGPGHVGYTKSLDGKETWITYHAAEYPDRIFGNRIARVEKLEWDEEGWPVYPKPHGFFEPMPLPSE